MLTPTTYTLVAAAAALSAMALASWNPSDAGMATQNPQMERSAARSADSGAQAGYLPSRFAEEERSAPVEPLPPQF